MAPAPDFQLSSYGGYSPLYFDPAAQVSNYQNVYNDFVPASQPLAPYQGIDNCGYDASNQYGNVPMDEMVDAIEGRDPTDNWNPINLAKLYPKLYMSPSGTFSNVPSKRTSNQLLKNSEKNTEDAGRNFINFDTIPFQRSIGNGTKENNIFNKDTWRKLFKQMAKGKRGGEKAGRIKNDYCLYTPVEEPFIEPDKVQKNEVNKDMPQEEPPCTACQMEVPENMEVPEHIEDPSNTNASSLASINVQGERLLLPERLVKKKSAQMKALQNLSKLKAMIHMAKEERRTVQHKREEARRQFLSEVAEELQLMSSAKLAEIEASKSYRTLSAAERALADKDRDIHMLLEKEDSLYEDLTDAEASLAKADMNFIPKIKSEDELRQFASFLNFGF